MIIVLGANQAFTQQFATWLRAHGHVVDICPDEPESFIVDGNGTIAELFDDYSEGESFNDERNY